MIELILWIIVITCFTCFGSWYAKKYNRPDALIGLYVAFVLISNIIAFKIVEFDLWFYTFYATAATLVFAVTFLMTDIVNEKFGIKETQKMIIIAFVSQLAVSCFIWISLLLKPAPFFTGNSSFIEVLSFAPRVMIAGWIAFFISENLDAYVFYFFKKLTKGRYLWLRNISGIFAMLLDSLIFVTIAFYPNKELFSLIIGVTVIKWLVGVIDIPFMYLNRYILYYKKKN